MTATAALTWRSCVIGVFAMLLLGMWVHFHEVLLPQPLPIAENSPPAAGVGIFLGLLLVAGLVTWFRPRLRLTQPELCAIYAMLIIAGPLMSQGMWHRFPGLIAAIPHHSHNLVLADSYSNKLWPHGPRLLDDDYPLAAQADPPDALRIVEVPGRGAGIELTGGDHDAASRRVSIRVARHRHGREALVPGERYYVTCLARLTGGDPRSRLGVDLVSDSGESTHVVALNRQTEHAYSRPGGLQRIGEPYVVLPRDIRDSVELVFTLQGRGQATIADVQFFSNEALARMYKGSAQIAAGELDRLPANQRDALLIRPDSLTSPTGLWFLLKGYIPYRQWLTPALYWSSIVLAMFLCTLSLAVIFRKQWADHERFTFPLLMVPRLLIDQRDEDGRLVRPLLRKAAFWWGGSCALAYSLMLGLAHHVPGVPSLRIDIPLAQYFNSPAMIAAVNGFGGTNSFRVLWLFVAIAFFVDLELLASVLIFAVLVHVPYFLGEVFGWRVIAGPVDSFPFAHEQHIGAFLMLALMVLWVSRRHLGAVARRVAGLSGGADDSQEAMRYRTATALFLATLVFFGLWGWRSGLGAASALVFFGFLVVCGLSAARIRTELGAPATYFTPYYPYLIFLLLGGLATFGTATLVLAFIVGGFMAVAQFLMFAPSQVEMLQLGRERQARPRGMAAALIVGALGGLFIGGYVMLVWAYGVGGENIPHMRDWALSQDWYLASLRNSVTAADAQVIATGEAEAKYHAGPLAAVGVGAVITALLTLMRSWFVGFWLNPIGYIVANSHFIYGVWGSVLVAYVIKAAALKLGGPRLVSDQGVPFFVGVFCGCVVGMAGWDAVALITLTLAPGGISGSGLDVFVLYP